MENENSIIGIKINETDIPAKCIMIIKKYQNLPISEIKKKIEDNQYVLTCDYIDKSGIEKILELYSELNSEGIKCELYEHYVKTTTEFLNNLLESYNQTEIEAEEDIEREVQSENCEWEPEHGIDIIMLDNKVMDVGPGEGLSPWSDDDEFERLF